MSRTHARLRRAFTLVETLMVVMIIGMISSMAIPRISNASSKAARVTLEADLAIVRTAINLYAAEHLNAFPGPSAARFVAHLTQYTDLQGNTAATRGGAFIYGPYLLRLPDCPVGQNKKSADVLIDAANSPPVADPSGGEGWVYNPNTGEFYANTGLDFQAGVKLDSVGETGDFTAVGDGQIRGR